MHGKITLPPEVQEVGAIGDMISAVYRSPVNADLFNDRAILAPKNVDVDNINSIIMNQYQAEEHTYTSIDSCEDGIQASYPLKFLNSLKINDLPPHKMTLKVGSIVMCIRNINKAEGLMNGTERIPGARVEGPDQEVCWCGLHQLDIQLHTEGNFKGIVDQLLSLG